MTNRRSSPGHAICARNSLSVSSATGTHALNCRLSPTVAADSLKCLREARSVHKENDRDPDIAPGCVTEDLVERLVDGLRTFVELALADEEVLILLAK